MDSRRLRLYSILLVITGVIVGILLFVRLSPSPISSQAATSLSDSDRADALVVPEPVIAPPSVNAERATDARVFGYVQGPAGDRIAHAIVQFTRPVTAQPPEEILYEADENGEFEFLADFSQVSHFWLAVVGVGVESGQARFVVEALRSTDPVVLTAFPNTAVIAGRLVNRDKQAQPLRRLVAVSSQKDALTTTSESGAFIFERLLPGAYSFYVLKDGVMTQADQVKASMKAFTNENVIRAAPEVTIASGQQLAGLTLEIGQGGRIWGQVRDQTHAPVEGVRLMAWPAGNADVIATSFSDSAGYYELEGIPDGAASAEITIQHRDFEAIQTRVEVDSEFDVLLKPLARIAGRVLDSVSREPVPTFRIAAWVTDVPVPDRDQAIDRLRPSTFTADDDGRFELMARTAETTLGVMAEGYKLALHRVFPLQSGEILILLEPSTTQALRGIVVDPQQVPAGGAGVILGTGTTPEAVTNVSGHFTIDRVPENVDTLSAIKEGFGRGTVRVSHTDAEAFVTIRLTELASIRGFVTVDGIAAARQFNSAALFAGTTQAPTRHVYGGALQDGYFELTDVSPGRYFLEVSIDAARQVIRSELQIAEGSTAIARFDFETHSRGIVEGIVSRASTPCSGARLLLRRSLGAGQTLILVTRTDGQGRYTFSNVPAGACELELVSGEGDTAGANRFTFTLSVDPVGVTHQDIVFSD